ncbi:serine/threonine-protein kinase [Haliea sp. E1-2-M8]|uniref:serine/threonine-protein kinase n=1 Tax=Haliea sp. E1-2-M8 TaxID=3064706 RepID=UPI002726478A|nr:serine/threonine-protein kinase [Haliea sp. E1-2-M8]MDO8863112.1 serine/threonine-protein kinase [Haliea sp. E1-2-M8]
MHSGDFQRLEQLFNTTMDLPKDEQQAFLLRSCDGDLDLLEAVKALLHHSEQTANFTAVVEHSALDMLTQASMAEGDAAGAYRILEKIGQGGMGTVYLAARADDEYQQRVAVKVINRLAGDNADIQRRFQDERQILANLQHPNIVRLLDGGSLADGSPFLVMEYVHGERIDAWCKRENLSVDKILVLFAKVCHAVQHAHQNLVVHRDLKPSNIVIGADGEPKLMDFGIAKLLKPEGDASDPPTELGNRVLTPMYASPEQLNGNAVSTLSDVYSLGVILHELLVGQRPFDDGGTNSWSYAQRIIDEDPRAPSRRLGLGVLRGDLDNILLTALARDPHRRYQSAGALAADLDSCRRRRPIAARPRSLAYLAVRFIQRNQLASALLLAVVMAVSGFGYALYQQAILLQQERDFARGQLARTTAVLDLVEDMFSGLAPNNSQGRTVTVREMLDHASMELDQGRGSFSAAPAAVTAVIRRIIGATYNHLGLIDPAERHLSEALALHRTGAVRDEAEKLRVIRQLSQTYHLGYGYHEERLRLNLEAQALSERLYGPGSQEAFTASAELASSYHLMGRLQEARALYDEVYRGQLALLGEVHPDTISSLSRLAVVDYWLGNFATALAAFEQCHATAVAVLGETHTLSLACLERRGLILETMGRYSAAVAPLEQHVSLGSRVLGRSHPATLRTMHSLADSHRGLKQYDVAERLFLEVLALRREALGETNIETLQTEMKLARVYRLTRRFAEATPLITHALDNEIAEFGFEHPTTLIAAQEMAELLLDSRELGEAGDLLARVLSAREQVLGVEHPELQGTLLGLARVDRARERPASARGHLLRALALWDQNPEYQPQNRRRLLNLLIEVSEELDGPEAALQYREQMVQLSAQAGGT